MKIPRIFRTNRQNKKNTGDSHSPMVRQPNAIPRNKPKV